MPKVLVYRHTLLPPSETFIHQQVKLLDRWSPTLFGQATAPKGLDLSDIDHHVVTLFGRDIGTLSGRWQTVARRFGLLNHALVKQARAFGPDLVHAHFGMDGLQAHQLSTKLGIPLLVTLHGYDASILPTYWRSGGMGEHLRSYPDQLRDMAMDPKVSFTAVSHALKAIAVEQYALPAEKIKVLHLGIDPDRFPPSVIPMVKRPLKVLFVGRMVEKKAPEVLVKALAEVRTQGVAAEATFIGDGPLLDKVKALAALLKVPARFLGVQGADVVRHELEDSRLFCLPSVRASSGDSEGLPMVLLEAQASGVPVVTSAVGGRDEGMLPGETGLSFPEGDEQALARAMLTLLPDTTTLQAMANRGPSYIRSHHNARTWCDHLQAHYSILSVGTREGI
jgi:colanic acid/amylovoran biosynthesis glycosyltransferase